jgi:serine/threonine-protein kinase
MSAVNPQDALPDAATPKACPSCGKRYTADALFCPLDGSPLTTAPGAIAAAAATDPYVGREILGHIEIRQLVGIGAMGRVYRAFQKGIDRDVAVKILHRELSANQMLVARFHREAKVASRLAHPHVVHVLLVGQLPDGAMYIVMEYLDGMSLQSALAGVGGAMPLPRALHIALQLCDAAGEAHAQGIVHRDLKPENVMLVKRADDPDFVKVLDFGIARLNWGDQSMATAAGLIFGTARYISPEGAQGETVGPQGDVYSIATIVYQCLSGRTPFDAEQAVALLVQQIHDSPAPLKSLARAAYVPEPIADVIMANLAKAAAHRLDSARAFGRALLQAAVASGLSAQDILARPAMISGRAQQSSFVQMAPLQRTRALPLEPADAARLEAATAASGRWTGDNGGSAGAPPKPPAKTEYIEPSAEVGRTPVRTEIAEPTGPVHAPAHSPHHGPPPGAATTKWTPPADFATKLVTAPPHVPAPHRQVSQPGNVDLTMDDQQLSTRMPPLPTPAPAPASATAPPAHSRQPTPVPPQASYIGHPPSIWPFPHGRAAMLVVGCFLVGAMAVGAYAYHAGYIGSGGRTAQPAPSSDVHAKPTVIDPPAGATEAREESAASSQPLPPLTSTRIGTGAASVGSSSRVVIDASNAKPVPGQPVDFTAHISAPASAHPKVEGAVFRVAGPGVAPGTQLAASDDGSGAYMTTFAFLQPGRFEVTFAARADGAAVRGARVVVVQAAQAATTAAPPAGELPPTPAPAAAPATPAPAGSVKWL